MLKGYRIRAMSKTTTWFGLNIFSENIPQYRPGVYLIENISNGMKYIGISQNVAKRLRQHLAGDSRKSKVGNAIRAEGRQQFRAIPLFYSLAGMEDLNIIETALIREHRSVENGYNIVEGDGKSGPHGAAFYAVFQRPEVKMKLRSRRRAIITESERKAISARMTKFKNTDAEKRRVSDQMQQLFSDEEFKKKHLERSREANANPERREKIKAYRAGGCWINDDTTERFLPSGETVPAGWRKGRLKRASKY